MKRLLPLLTLATILVLAACGKTPEPQAAAAAGLAVSRSSVNTGDEVTLQWEVSNAASARLSSNNVLVLVPTAVELTGSMNVRVTASTVFTVTAFDRNGKALASAEAAVTVRAPGSPGDGPGTDPDPEDPDSPLPDPDPEHPGALRFDFSDAVGIQLGNDAGGLSTASASSNLYKVLADGSLELALVSGTAHVQQFFIRNGKIYVVFETYDYWGEEAPDCVLAEVDQHGEVTCIDSDIAYVEVQSVQFDAHGGIYYRGNTHDGQPVIRKSFNGVAIDYYKAEDAITIERFVATREGVVLLQGYSITPLDYRYWIRAIDETGRTTEYPYGEILDYLPDGSLLVDEDYGGRLIRFLTHDGLSTDPRRYCSSHDWLSNPADRLGINYDPNNYEVFGLCSQAREARNHNLLYRDADSVVALTVNGLTRIYPGIEAIPLPLERVTNGAIGLGRAVVSGFDSTRNPGAVLVDLDSGLITDMLGSRRIEVLRLMLRQDENRVLMYGLDLDRTQPVLAEYDLRLGILNVADVEHRLAENFQVLDWSANHIPPVPSVHFVPTPEFTAHVLEDWDVGRVAFDASGILPATWLNEATWDFGDGTTITLPAQRIADDWLQLTHEYSEGGNYTVTLTLIDQLGEEHTTQQNISVPQRVPATQVAGGSEHTVVVREDGTVWAWGRNDSGQLGIGTGVNRSYTPRRIDALSGILRIAVNSSHSLAVDEDGAVWAWGYNGSGQLGTGDSNNSYVPVRVNGLTNITHIAVGSGHSLAVDGDGVVWAWGYNYYGQLGNGTQMSSSVPVRVDGLASATQVVAGYSHSLAVDEDGVVWAWGHNDYGQLGNGSESSSSVPVRVNGLSNVTRVASGGEHVLAVDADGDVWAWGYNGYTELGNETWENSPVPLRVIGLPLAARTVAAGGHHSLGILEDGSTWAWGYNYYGQLGNDSDYSSGTPLRVLSFRWPGETDH